MRHAREAARRDERPHERGSQVELTVLDVVLISSIFIAVGLFEAWFMFKSGSPLDGRSGRSTIRRSRRMARHQRCGGRSALRDEEIIGKREGAPSAPLVYSVVRRDIDLVQLVQIS